MSDRPTAKAAAIRASLERTIATLHHVIADNHRLAEMPGHEESAARRIAEGEAELAQAEAELAALDDGSPPGAVGPAS